MRAQNRLTGTRRARCGSKALPTLATLVQAPSEGSGKRLSRRRRGVDLRPPTLPSTATFPATAPAAGASCSEGSKGLDTTGLSALARWRVQYADLRRQEQTLEARLAVSQEYFTVLQRQAQKQAPMHERGAARLWRVALPVQWEMVYIWTNELLQPLSTSACTGVAGDWTMRHAVLELVLQAVGACAVHIDLKAFSLLVRVAVSLLVDHRLEAALVDPGLQNGYTGPGYRRRLARASVRRVPVQEFHTTGVTVPELEAAWRTVQQALDWQTNVVCAADLYEALAPLLVYRGGAPGQDEMSRESAERMHAAARTFGDQVTTTPWLKPVGVVAQAAAMAWYARWFVGALDFVLWPAWLEALTGISEPEIWRAMKRLGYTVRNGEWKHRPAAGQRRAWLEYASGPQESIALRVLGRPVPAAGEAAEWSDSDTASGPGDSSTASTASTASPATTASPASTASAVSSDVGVCGRSPASAQSAERAGGVLDDSPGSDLMEVDAEVEVEVEAEAEAEAEADIENKDENEGENESEGEGEDEDMGSSGQDGEVVLETTDESTPPNGGWSPFVASRTPMQAPIIPNFTRMLAALNVERALESHALNLHDFTDADAPPAEFGANERHEIDGQMDGFRKRESLSKASGSSAGSSLNVYAFEEWGRHNKQK